MSTAVPGSNTMDRGAANPVLEAHIASAKTLSIRQTRKGWCQECLGCEAKDEFKFFKQAEPGESIFAKNRLESDPFAHALEDSGCCIRFCCSPCHPYKMSVKEVGTDAELLSMDRPFKCNVGACKCCCPCCYQQMSMTSGGQPIGEIKEQCWCCVPRFIAYDGKGNPLYQMHSPTCCCGVCVNCCAEGNPCGKGCCKASFRIYPADQKDTDGDAPYIGVILKTPKSLKTELFTDANAFDLTFPENATVNEKALLMGSAMFFNSNFFEGGRDE